VHQCDCKFLLFSLLHGAEREICCYYSSAIYVLDRKERIGICYELRPLFITRNGSGNLLNTCTISQGLFMFWTERNVLFKRCKELYYTDRNRNATERNGTGILFNRLGMSWGLSLLHGPEREICWIDRHIRQKGTDREICGLKQWMCLCLHSVLFRSIEPFPDSRLQWTGCHIFK